MKKIILLSVILLTLQSLSASKFSSLYADHKSFSVGDIITVVITEQSSAQVSSKESTKKSSKHDVSSAAGQGGFSFIPLNAFSLSTANDASGNASSTRQGSLDATMTARIISIDDNGNLILKGEKSVEINGEEQITTIEGTVRPGDVRFDNTIYSYNIADAKISYKGKGTVRDGSRIGFVSRILNYIF